MRRILLLAMVAAVGMFSFVGASSASPSDVSASPSDVSASPSNVAAALPSCRDFWLHSGHRDRVRRYHCHATSPSNPHVKRVHICGVSGTLHGITVAEFPDGAWVTNNHRHDVGGEGC